MEIADDPVDVGIDAREHSGESGPTASDGAAHQRHQVVAAVGTDRPHQRTARIALEPVSFISS